MAALPRCSVADSLHLDAEGCRGGFHRPLGNDEDARPHGGPIALPLVPDDSSTSDENVEADLWSREDPDEAHGRGVKEDLNELKQSLTRQLWGVANILAPPPSNSSTPSRSSRAKDESDREEVDATMGGCDGGSESGSDEEVAEEPVVGVQEVLNFARNIAMHPETWLDFPLDPDEDLDDFELSDAQREHVLAIENLSPRLRALRIELCPCHMSESYFWKVYFVLLHSRLEKHVSEILSTPQVMEARALWMQELHKQSEIESDWLGSDVYHMKTGSVTLREEFPDSPGYMLSGGMPFKSFDFKSTNSPTSEYSDSEKCLSLSSEMQMTGESVVGEIFAIDAKNSDRPPIPLSKMCLQKFEDEEDDEWLDDDSDLGGYNLGIITIGSNEDVSFSDLEDDGDVAMRYTI
ncbi:hypothetical protein MLD38_001717 [Melastoma candidum]|uniref:Uncharacterized protein n=1 Tax=Melastoma candidum TaxID=119954 RepID=A0ACB9SF42_9MYRT|nr:hypothetical protein MLD38_001717 [Melastoma candidum]